MTGNSRYVRSLVAAAGMLSGVAALQTRAVGQTLPVAEVGTVVQLKEAQEAAASGRLIRAKNILTALNTPSRAATLSDDDRLKVLRMLSSVSKRIKSLTPVSVSLQTAEEGFAEGDLRTAEYHARAVVDAPKATNEDVGQARALLDGIASEHARLAPSVQGSIESAVAAFDAGRFGEAKSLLDSIVRSGVKLSDGQSSTVASYQTKLIDVEHASGQRIALDRVDAGMVQPGVVKRRKPAQPEPATPAAPEAPSETADPKAPSTPAATEPAPSAPAPAPAPTPESTTPAATPVAPASPSAPESAPAPAQSAPAPAESAPATPTGSPDQPTEGQPVSASPAAAAESTPASATAPASQAQPASDAKPWWNSPSWRWNWQAEQGNSSNAGPSSATGPSSEQSVAQTSQANQPDPLQSARVMEAAAQLAEADAAFDGARFAEASNRYESLLSQSAGLLSAEQKAHCEMRLNECRARLGAGGASILESTLESRKLAREAATAEYESYLADSRKAIDSGDVDAARSNLAAARIRIRSAAQFFAQDENEGFENSLEQLNGRIESASIAIENRTREDQARRQQLDAELAQNEAAEARAQKIADAIDRTRALQSEQKYSEALQVVDEILFLDPVNPTGLLLRDALTDLDIMSRYADLRRKKLNAAANYRLEAEAATVVGPDVMNFADDWPKLSARRGEPIAFADAEENRRTLALLESKKSSLVMDSNTTLEQALSFIKQAAGVELDVDWDSLQNIGIEKGSAVSLSISKVSAKVLLDKVLERVSEDPDSAAAWTIKEGMVFVASKEEIDRNKVLAIYDIKDLLVVIPDFEDAPEFNLQSVLQSGQGGGQSPFQDQGGGNEDEELPTSDELTDELVDIIEKSVDPDSWTDEASIQRFQQNLIITQTPANHREVRSLLSKLREQRSMQVNVEGRFLLVAQQFFEQIGFDLDVYWNGKNNQVKTARRAPGAASQSIMPSDFFDFSNGGLQRRVVGSFPGSTTPVPDQTVALPGPLSVIGTPSNSLGLTEFLTQGEFARSIIVDRAPALGIGGQFLDDIQVDFLVKATQADRRTVTLTAPRLTFTNGQRSWVAVATQIAFVSDLSPTVSESAVGFDPDLDVVSEGVVLDVDGTISADRRYVFLTVRTAVSKVEGFSTVGVTAVAGGQLVNSADTQSFIQTPTVTVTQVKTSVTVPDQGTLLLGGQRLITEGEVETGVPVLSKLPIIKRFFTNRTETKEEQTLLILIKPTILIQTEEEERHFPGISQLQGASGG